MLHYLTSLSDINVKYLIHIQREKIVVNERSTACQGINYSSRLKNNIYKFTILSWFQQMWYVCISHIAGLKALKDVFDCNQNKKIQTDMPVQIVEFVLTNNYFEYGQKVLSIGTKFASPYACIFMDKFETDLLKMQKLQSFVGFRYERGT